MNLKQLPNPGAYVKAWRTLKSLPPQTPVKSRDLNDWFNQTRTAGEMLGDFRAALDRRINARGGDFEANQPIPAGYFRDMRAVSDRIHRRVRVFQFETQEVRARFGHLLSSRWD